MKVVITAGGTGGHILPALSVAIEFRKQYEDLSLLWIGTSRSREKELCLKYNIELKILEVTGIKRKLHVSSLFAIFKFIYAVVHMRSYFKNNTPDLIIAFGGYVCAPVLAAAKSAKIPYYLQEQNSIPGVVNRYYSSNAQCTFLGYPLHGKWKLKGRSEITGTPIRKVSDDIKNYNYPETIETKLPTIMISGGSQGAASMNEYLIEPVKKFLNSSIQVIWQTGSYSFDKINSIFGRFPHCYIFSSCDDLYPYYSIANIIICRSGAGTLSEIAYFGLPCIMIPLPWAAEDHQWENAGFVESAGWGIRIAQDEKCSEKTFKSIQMIFKDKNMYERMSQRALDNSPDDAAKVIVQKIMEERY